MLKLLFGSYQGSVLERDGGWWDSWDREENNLDGFDHTLLETKSRKETIKS